MDEKEKTIEVDEVNKINKVDKIEDVRNSPMFMPDSITFYQTITDKKLIILNMEDFKELLLEKGNKIKIVIEVEK